MANKGWIRIHRQLQECQIWVDSEPFDKRSAWIDLLMSANHEDKSIIFDYKSITIKRGQYLTSVRKLAERWSWSKNRVLKYLRLLEMLHMITRESDGRRTVITIENYDKFQSDRDSDMDSDMDTDMDTPIDGGMDTGMPQTIMKKNDKKEKKNIYGEYRHVRLTKTEYDRLISKFGETETLDAIKFLDEYKQRKGYKSTDDNLTIQKWVFDAVKRDKAQSQPSETKNKKIHNYEERKYDYDAIMADIVNK